MKKAIIQVLNHHRRLGAAALGAILLTIGWGILPNEGSSLPAVAAAEPGNSGSFKRWTRSSQYIPVRDGIRIAIDIYRPADESGVAVNAALPVVWTCDRYYRAKMEEGNFVTKLDRTVWLRRLLAHGYAIVIADARGAGASFGRWDGPFFQKEAEDAFDITEWIASQPWSNGRIGMFGRSYMAVSQLLAASSTPPHLRAIFPEMPLFDLYNAAYTGGIFRDQFIRQWGKGLANTDVVGIAAPVDDDPGGVLLEKARLAHSLNPDVFEMLRGMPFRDSAYGPGRSPLYLTRDLAKLIEGISKSKIGIYQLTGWRDVWTKDAFLWHTNLDNPRKLVIGPWSHNTQSGFDIAGEHLRWYDYFLKGSQNGILDEPPIRYYTINAPPGKEWQSAATWPPPGTESRRFHFQKGRSSTANSANDGRLSIDPPAESSVDEYVIDYMASSGIDSRWNLSSEEPGNYREMGSNESRGLTYTSEPLKEDIEVTGHPILNLRLSSNGEDINLFAYLSEIHGNGFSQYVTEGSIKVSHRLAMPAPIQNLGLPYHQSFRSDIQILGPNPDEVSVDLMPVSYLFHSGNRIRITLTGADRGNAYTTEVIPAPRLKVHHGLGNSSFVTLPVIREAALAIENTRPQIALWTKLTLLGAILLITVWIVRARAKLKDICLALLGSRAIASDRRRTLKTSKKGDA
jgi:uncharacterized protein